MPNDKYSGIKLYELLKERFNDAELRDICAFLKVVNTEIDYEDLVGESKSERLQNLIYWFSRRLQLDEFIAAVQERRKDIKETHLFPALLDKSANSPIGSTSQPADSGNARRSYTTRQKLEIYLYRRGWEWWLYVVCIPLALLLALYLFERSLGHVAYAYRYVFGYGDLILFSAVILLSVSVQFKRSHHQLSATGDQQSAEHKHWYEAVFPVAVKVWAFMLLAFMGMLKHSIIQQTASVFDGAPPAPYWWSSGINLLLTLASVIVAVNVYSQSKKNELDVTSQP